MGGGGDLNQKEIRRRDRAVEKQMAEIEKLMGQNQLENIGLAKKWQDLNIRRYTN